MNAVAQLAIAALVGLGVGVEREWSVQTSGRPARFAGLRTFAMLGVVGGCAGMLLGGGYAAAAAALLAGPMALAVAAYVMAERRGEGDPDGTTEVAALLVVALGVLAGLGRLALAAGAGAATVLVLSEKQALHAAVRHIQQGELRAALRFGVLALVVLPLLPEGPVLGPLALRPRGLWIIVLIFSGLSFAGFLARRAFGQRRGYEVVGLLGGLISSTAVTLDFSRHSRREPALARPLALGAIGACTVLLPRVLLVSAALNPPVALALLPILAPTVGLGALLAARTLRAHGAGEIEAAPSAVPGNPLRLWMAIRMAVAFQVALTAIGYVRAHWPVSGLYGTAALLGLTDMDALTVGMSRPVEPLPAPLAARAITVGILTNTVFKLGLAAVLGGPDYRRWMAVGLTAMGAAIALGLALLG